ncbi:MAG: hypothetical protein JXR66_05395 [Bacteroidales bacterium]|nr:hypothetical protein [Bacteroidales bacterium]
MLLANYFFRPGNVNCYHFEKSRKTLFIEGIVYLILAISLSGSFYILEHPYRLQEKASSVRTGEKKLENYYKKANAESDLKLLSSLASNPMLPVCKIEEIYDKASVLLSSGDRQYINLFDALARNIKTPGEILSEISLLNNYNINKTIARNPNTPVEVLSAFAKEGSVAMKISVARNPNTTAESLTILAGENHYVIRRWVARHKNVTMETLMLLADDTDERVRTAALGEIEKYHK